VHGALGSSTPSRAALARGAGARPEPLSATTPPRPARAGRRVAPDPGHRGLTTHCGGDRGDRRIHGAAGAQHVSATSGAIGCEVALLFSA
jgi:hypothetical protein